jgi:hypothetical protein
MRIACDLDGTLADMGASLEHAATGLFPGTPMSGLTQAQIEALWAHVRASSNFWTSLEEIEPGAVARLAALAARHRWELVFLTQRPDTAGDSVRAQTAQWLAARGVPAPSVRVTTGSRGQLAALLAVDVVVDDDAENCLAVATESSARPMLVWREARRLLPPGAARLGIDTVFSMHEALDRLEQSASTRR